MDWRVAWRRRRARSSGEGFEGEDGFDGEVGLGGEEVGGRWSFGLVIVGVESVVVGSCKGEGPMGLSVDFKGVLKGDLKGLERAEELERRRRLSGGVGDMVSVLCFG